MQAIVQGLIEIYSSVQDKLRPTPTQAHYIFTMHDIGRVLNGMLLMSPRSKIKPKKRGESLLSLSGDVTITLKLAAQTVKKPSLHPAKLWQLIRTNTMYLQLVLVSNNNMHIDIKPCFCLLYRSILKYRGMRCFPLGHLPNSFARFSISRNVNKYGVSALAVSESLQK